MSSSRPHLIAPRAHHEIFPPARSRLLVALVAGSVVATGAIVAGQWAGSGSAPGRSLVHAVSAAAADRPAAEPLASENAQLQSVDLDGCELQVALVSKGDEGESVTCVQKALTAAGFYHDPITGAFDDATAVATKALQLDRGLFVDGLVGARTAESLGIWPGAESFVVRTPPPAPGATDLLGFPLSSVASAGADAPPMPPDSGQGTGKRVVYDRAGQRVWAVDDEERVVRSYLVTGSRFRNELPGEHRVYSRSEVSTAWNFEADLPLMVRYLKTERGNIGFHQIPIHKDDGTAYQTEDELGEKLSGGCQRQAPRDARFMWEFAQLGTRVIVT